MTLQQLVVNNHGLYIVSSTPMSMASLVRRSRYSSPKRKAGSIKPAVNRILLSRFQALLVLDRT